jgi:L-alanine-DL-glutamate epimerase-like enolase superfamily enzyme
MEENSPKSGVDRRQFVKSSLAASAGLAMAGTASAKNVYGASPKLNLKITDLKCAIIGQSPVVRITTNEGIDGYGEAERAKSYLKPFVLFYRDYLLNEDPTDVERIMLKIRRLGGFKPWGSAVSAIEMALWDIAGKASGLPVYKLLGGKIRDRVRVYNGGVRVKRNGNRPEDYAENMEQLMSAKEKFSIIKMGLGFHSPMPMEIPNFFMGEPKAGSSPGAPLQEGQMTKTAPHPNRGPLTEKGMNYLIKCVEAMKKVMGDEVGLALDLGPGYTLTDSIRLAKAFEPLNLTWLEDMLTGDYHPYVLADVYRELTQSTTTPIFTGEQIYLRQNFRELIEGHAVRMIGPDPADVGGLAEFKWIAEYADLHGILIAAHGIFNGLIGLAAQVHLGAVCPENYLAFEYPVGKPDWWYDIVEGLPDPIVEDGHVKVWNTPGLGVNFKVKEAKKRLQDEDKGFFD